MEVYFKPVSHQLENKKFVAEYIRITGNDLFQNERVDSWNKEFYTQQEADGYAIGYCLQQGYKLIG